MASSWVVLELPVHMLLEVAQQGVGKASCPAHDGVRFVQAGDTVANAPHEHKDACATRGSLSVRCTQAGTSHTACSGAAVVFAVPL